MDIGDASVEGGGFMCCLVEGQELWRVAGGKVWCLLYRNTCTIFPNQGTVKIFWLAVGTVNSKLYAVMGDFKTIHYDILWKNN